jgi:glutamyl-tRNA reductase
LHVIMLGISHHTAPLAVRERFALTGDLRHPMEVLRSNFAEAAVLATCNRTELYALADHPHEGLDALSRCVAAIFPAEFPQWHNRFYRHAGQAAVRHLMRVACGLESMVIGEAEILGQVKQALASSTEYFPNSKVLPRLFRDAIDVGRKARLYTAIGQSPASISSVAVELAQRVLGDFRSRGALLVGTGTMGQALAQILKSKGIQTLIVATSDPSRHQGGFPGADSLLSLGDVPLALPCVDLLIAATTSHSPVIGAETIGRALELRRGRPLVVIDLAIPRNVAPEVRTLPSVFMYDLDQLQKVAAENLQRRQAEVSKVEDMIELQVAKFARWLGSQNIIPTILALRRKAEAIRRSELKRFGHQIEAMAETDRKAIEMLTERIVTRLLHEPTVKLKGLADRDRATAYARAIADLFNLPAEQAAEDTQ